MASSGNFAGDTAKLYMIISEAHRNPMGPWALFLQQVGSLQLPENATLVDLASGPGEPALTLAKAFPSLNVFSTDLSVDMHKGAARKAVTQHNLKAMVVDMTDLSAFETNSVDCVTVCYGYMFPEDKAKALRETFRILKPGGKLLSTHWKSLNFFQIGLEILEGVLGLEAGTAPRPAIDPMTLAGPGVFDALCESAGFTISDRIDGEYPFNIGPDPDTRFRLATMTVKSKLDELGSDADVLDKARRFCQQSLNRYGTIEGDDLLIHGNCFCMTVANKPL